MQPASGEGGKEMRPEKRGEPKKWQNYVGIFKAMARNFDFLLNGMEMHKGF